jgi:hypothetical protein
MKSLLVSLLLFSFSALADSQTQPQTQEILVEMQGEYQPVDVNTESLNQILRNSAFYECRAVPGGWRRCSKRTGRCFGAVFRLKQQCLQVLNGDDD